MRDFEKSLHFYQTLTELKIHTQFSANSDSIAYLQNANGETQLELIGMPEGETVSVRYVPLLRYGGYRIIEQKAICGANFAYGRGAVFAVILDVLP